MKTLIAAAMAMLVLAGCGSSEDEKSDDGSSAKATETSTPSPTPSATADAADPLTPPSPLRPRLGQPFTATVQIDKTWTRVRITLTAIDTYTGEPFPELKGTPMLYRYRATNLGPTIVAPQDPVSYHFAGLDEKNRRTTPGGYYPGSAASPGDCYTLPDKVSWKSGQTLRACSVQTVAKGSKLVSAAFLSGDPEKPQVAEFRLP